MACAALLLLLSAASASPVAPPPAVDCNPAANPPEMCPGSHPCPKCGKPSCPCTGGGPAPPPAPTPPAPPGPPAPPAPAPAPSPKPGGNQTCIDANHTCGRPPPPAPRTHLIQVATRQDVRLPVRRLVLHAHGLRLRLPLRAAVQQDLLQDRVVQERLIDPSRLPSTRWRLALRAEAPAGRGQGRRWAQEPESPPRATVFWGVPYVRIAVTRCGIYASAGTNSPCCC